MNWMQHVIIQQAFDECIHCDTLRKRRSSASSATPWGAISQYDQYGSLNVPMFHITQPLDSIRYMVYNGYYKVMSNIPKMGHLTTPDQYACINNETRQMNTSETNT